MTPANCANCVYSFVPPNAPTGNGVCRRFPPIIVAGNWLTQEAQVLQTALHANPPRGATVSQVQNISSEFPPVALDLGWCGEYETKDALQ